MFRRILKGQARRWYVNDVGIPLVACSAAAEFLATVLGPATTRIGAALMVASAEILVGAVGLLATPLVQKQLNELWVHYRSLKSPI
jgi:hypothetical protein